MASSRMVRRSTPVSISIDCWLSVICREVWTSRAKQESKSNLKRMKWLRTEARDKLGLKQEFRSQAADSGHHLKENMACGQLSPSSLTFKLSLSEVLSEMDWRRRHSRACQILGVMELKLAVPLSTQDSLECHLQWALKCTLHNICLVFPKRKARNEISNYITGTYQ